MSSKISRHAVRQVRDKDLRQYIELGVYEKDAVKKYVVNPIDSKRVDTDKALGETQLQTRSRLVARESRRGDRPDLHAL